MKQRFIFYILPIFIAAANFAAQVAATDDRELQSAKQLYQRGEYDKAVSRYEKLTGSSDHRLSARALLGLAEVQTEIGRYQEAEKTIQDALVRLPNNPEALALRGIILKRMGRYDAARSQFQKAIELDPNQLLARLNLGILQWQWGEKVAARQTLQYFIDYYRSNLNFTGQALALIARACIYLDRFKDANDLFYDATNTDKTLWQAFVAWGELFLSKYNIADAQSTFQDAIKINPNSAEAHLGLAKCLRESNFEQAIASAEHALSINPNLIAAHDFLADLEIAVGDYEKALDKLKKPLEENPQVLSSRTLRAVVYFFLEKKERFAEEEKQILSINPAYSDLYFQVAEVLAKRYLFKESVEYYEKALKLDPENWSARAGLGTSLSRLGKEEAAKQQLERAFARDPYNKYVGNLLTLFDEFPQYKTHRTEHFTIRIHEKDDAVLSAYAQRLAEESFANLSAKYPLANPESVVLEIFPEHDDFAVRCFGIPGAQAFLGICFGNLVAMDSPRARSKGDFVWGQTLWHELVHVTHLKLTNNRIPRWLAEGIAVYETGQARPYWQMGLDVPFVMAFKNKRTLPLKDLDSGFNRPTSPGQVSLSYFQASLIVEFIVEKYGRDKILAMFPEFRSGLKTNAVIQKVFGKDVDEIDDEFNLYVREKYHLDSVDYEHDPRELAAAAKGSNNFSADKLGEESNNPFLNYQFGMYYKKQGDLEKAVTYLEKAKAQFPNFVENANPYSALADIYLETGEKRKAILELRQLTGLNGRNLPALKQLGDLCLESQDYDCVIESLSKAIYVTPFDSDVHRKLATAYEAKDELDKAIEELRINLLTGPQDLAGAHCDLAEALLKAGRKLDAKESALAALEIAPSYERAQEILLASME
ncbi:MAG: tetratricopeptide repeat protein [bacterium]